MKISAWITVVSLATGVALFPVETVAGLIYSGGTYSQNFDSLASSGTGNAWANDSTISGWYLFDRNSTAITTYNAGTGSSTTGNFYSFGSSSSSERAFGGLGSGGAYFGTPPDGAIAGWIAVAIENQTRGTLSSFTVSFNGEQWRNSAAAAQTMVFEYGFGSSFSSVSTWTAPGGNFDWTSPVTGGTAGQVDGNSAGLVSGRGGTISGVTWAQNDLLWLRWVERNDSGSDHGLAIDDFALQTVPEPKFYALYCALGLLAISGGRAWLDSRRRRQPNP